MKTAFEALSGTSKSHCTARFLRQLFEAIPHTTPLDSKRLVWSPEERPVHTLTSQRMESHIPICLPTLSNGSWRLPMFAMRSSMRASHHRWSIRDRMLRTLATSSSLPNFCCAQP